MKLEIVALKEMLEKAGIPHEFIDHRKLGVDEIDCVDKIMDSNFQILYRSSTGLNERICSVVQNKDSRGSKDNLIDIVGLTNIDEDPAGEGLGFLKAENVFKRIKRHYRDFNSMMLKRFGLEADDDFAFRGEKYMIDKFANVFKYIGETNDVEILSIDAFTLILQNAIELKKVDWVPKIGDTYFYHDKNRRGRITRRGYSNDIYDFYLIKDKNYFKDFNSAYLVFSNSSEEKFNEILVLPQSGDTYFYVDHSDGDKVKSKVCDADLLDEYLFGDGNWSNVKHFTKRENPVQPEKKLKKNKEYIVDTLVNILGDDDNYCDFIRSCESATKCELFCDDSDGGADCDKCAKRFKIWANEDCKDPDIFRLIKEMN